LAAYVAEDAASGGAETGAGIVEQVLNGSATSSVYGVYHDVVSADGTVLSNAETRWKKTLAEWDDEEVVFTPVDADELLARAAAAVEAEAGATKAAEDAEQEAIAPKGNKGKF
jgi:hypothetical protein